MTSTDRCEHLDKLVVNLETHLLVYGVVLSTPDIGKGGTSTVSLNFFLPRQNLSLWCLLVLRRRQRDISNRSLPLKRTARRRLSGRGIWNLGVSPWRYIVWVELSKLVVRDRSKEKMVLVCIVWRNRGVIWEMLSTMNILKMSGPVCTDGYLERRLICCGGRKRVVVDLT